MPRNELGDALSFLDGTAVDPISRGGGNRRGFRSIFVVLCGIAVHAVIIGAFLQFMGIVHIPRLEWLTRDRLLTSRARTESTVSPSRGGGPQASGVRSATMPPRPVSPRPPVRFPNSSAALRTTVAKPSAGGRADGPSGGEVAGPTGPKTKPTNAATQALDPPSARALLERRGLIRVASNFVLESESEAQSKLVALRARAAEFNATKEGLIAAQWSVERIGALDQAITMTNATVAELNFQMGQFTPTYFRGRWVHGMNMGDEATFQGLKAQRDGLVRERDTTMVPERDMRRREQPGRKLAEATEKVKVRREAALVALSDMREAVVATSKRYDELAQDGEVKRALATIGQSNLAPSPEFVAAVQVLRDFERSAGFSTKTDMPKSTNGRRAGRPETK